MYSSYLESFCCGNCLHLGWLGILEKTKTISPFEGMFYWPSLKGSVVRIITVLHLPVS